MILGLERNEWNVATHKTRESKKAAFSMSLSIAKHLNNLDYKDGMQCVTPCLFIPAAHIAQAREIGMPERPQCGNRRTD